MKSYPLWVFALSSVLCLAACGGGGKGKSPIDQAESSLNAVAEKAEHLFITGQVFTARSQVRPGERIELTCDGLTCANETEASYFSINEGIAIQDDTEIRVGPVINGVQLREFRDRNEENDYFTDFTAYGAWLTDSAFYVTLQNDDNETEVIRGQSFGDASRTNPASALSGTATWRGAMVARDATNATVPITGRTELTYDFGGNTLDVLMSQIRGSRAYADLTWEDLAVTEGQFSQGSGADSIRGTFYGDDHEEVGGIFERSNLVGAFGATRQ